MFVSKHPGLTARPALSICAPNSAGFFSPVPAQEAAAPLPENDHQGQFMVHILSLKQNKQFGPHQLNVVVR